MGTGKRIGETGGFNSNVYSNGFYWTNTNSGDQYVGMEVAKAGNSAQITPYNSSQGFSIMPVQNAPYPPNN